MVVDRFDGDDWNDSLFSINMVQVFSMTDLSEEEFLIE